MEKQPDDSTYKKTLQKLAFADMVDRGFADSKLNRTISNLEMKRRISSWRK